MKLSNEELLAVRGGMIISAAVLNAIARIYKTAYDIGYALGSYIRRKVTKSYC